MNQAQRKRLLAEAQERLRLADEAVQIAQLALNQAQEERRGIQREVSKAREEYEKDKPLTESQEKALLKIYQAGGRVACTSWGVRGSSYEINGVSESLASVVFRGLYSRGAFGTSLQGNHWSDTVYPLSDWGKQVAEALAKAGEGRG